MLPLFIFIFLLHHALGNKTEEISNKTECFFNEKFSKCQGHCQDYCDWDSGSIKKPPCPKICKAGCVCSEEYVRQQPKGRGFCIPKTQCKKCPTHEHYDACSARCQNSCLSQDGKPQICPLICASGCVCDEGFARKDGTPQSQCVAIKDCP